MTKDEIKSVRAGAAEMLRNHNWVRDMRAAESALRANHPDRPTDAHASSGYAEQALSRCGRDVDAAIALLESDDPM